MRVRFVSASVEDAIGDPSAWVRRAASLGYLPWPLAGDRGVYTICPHCGAVGRVRWGADASAGPRWAYNGNPEAPTLSPSVLMPRCGFHCWVRAGVIIDAGTPPHTYQEVQS